MAQKYESESDVQSSLGLRALCERLRDSTGCGILELGPVTSGNLEFWSRFGPAMYIADLRSSLPLPPSDPEALEPVEPDWDSLLGLPEDRTYDVILAWDLLNYMELPAVSSLIRRLKRYCRPGAIFFALIFDQKVMPEQIAVYRIVDESHLRYEHAGAAMCPCPRHQPRALGQVMSGFRTADSFRLRNGVVEYLFEYEGNNSDGSEVQANRSSSDS